MKKKVLISVSLVVFIVIAFNIFIYFKNTINSEIVANLEGQIYYTKRVDGINKGFSEDKAISMVIKDHPEFPSNKVDTITKKLPTGGPPGTTADVKFKTNIENYSVDAYNVTITKDWGITVNGTYVKSSWKYKVTPENVVLVENVDNDYLPETIK